MLKFNIMVFPCGSEIGLEIHRSLKYSSHINLFGASSVDDHGIFVYETYIGDLPVIDSENIIPALRRIIVQYKIDAIYPTMDKVIWKLKEFESDLGCKVISSNLKTTEVCASKIKTYDFLKDYVKIPRIYSSIDEVDAYPVFIKPDIGYGSRGVFKAETIKELNAFFMIHSPKEYLIMEYLPNEEFTVDCFTDRKGRLLFVGPRKRNRIMNGISVSTMPINDEVKQFYDFANVLNSNLQLRGSWFFQLKKDKNGVLNLMEVASRLGGSSALFRGLGVNFALLSVYDLFDIDVEICNNNYKIQLDRALSNKYKVGIDYSTVYLDYDDCLLIHNKINEDMVTFLVQSINQKKKIILITKHEGNLIKEMKEHRIESLFDDIIQIDKNDKKIKYIEDINGIFIDDSFSERKEIRDTLGMAVFSPDMIEILIN